jgi:hypothetical protein
VLAAATTGEVHRRSGTRATDRSAVLVGGDQRLDGVAARAGCWVVADVLVAAGADRPHGPFGVHRPEPAATRAWTTRAGQAAVADHGAGANAETLAEPATYRACRLSTLIAAFTQVGAVADGTPGDGSHPVAATAEPARAVMFVAALTDGTVVQDDLRRPELTALDAGADGPGVAVPAQRDVVGEPDDGKGAAPALAAHLGHQRVLAVAGVADDTFRPASSDAASATAPRAHPPAGPRSAAAAQPSSWSRTQVVRRPTAGITPRRLHRMTGPLQHVREPNQAWRTVGRADDQGIRMGCQTSIQLPERLALDGCGIGQHGMRRALRQVGKRPGEVTDHTL